MVKKISLLVIVIIGALGSYYFLSQPKGEKKLNPVLWLPKTAEFAVKIDVSNHYLTLMKEFYNLEDSEQKDTGSVSLLVQELIHAKGAGLDFLSPFYFYSQGSDLGLLLPLKNKVKWQQFLKDQSTLLTPISDSTYSVKGTHYKAYYNHSLVALYKETVPEVSEVAVQFKEESKALVQAIVNKQDFKELQVEIDPTAYGWEVQTERPTYRVNDSSVVHRLPKGKAFVDIFIADVKDPLLQKGYEKAVKWFNLLEEIKDPIQVQYLGKGEKVIKSISYEYNDDFEMEEVVKIEKVPAEEIRLLINVSDINKAKNLQKKIEEKLGFLFQYSKATEHYVLFSEKEITPVKHSITNNVHSELSIKNSEELKALTNKFQFNKMDLPIDSIIAKEILLDSSIINQTKVYLPDSVRGVFGLKALMN